MSRSVIADSTLCIGYHTCEAACSETHRQRGLQSVLRLRVMLNEREPAPQLCHHCEDAPYAVVCPISAVACVDGVVQLNESLRVSCKLCGTAYPFGAIEFSDSRPLDIPANANTSETSSVPPAPARVSTLLDRVSGIRTIAIRHDLCSFDEQGPAYVRIYLTEALHLMDNTDITHVSKRKRELVFNMDFGDLILSQQAQGGGIK